MIVHNIFCECSLDSESVKHFLFCPRYAAQCNVLLASAASILSETWSLSNNARNISYDLHESQSGSSVQHTIKLMFCSHAQGCLNFLKKTFQARNWQALCYQTLHYLNATCNKFTRQIKVIFLSPLADKPYSQYILQLLSMSQAFWKPRRPDEAADYRTARTYVYAKKISETLKSVE